MRKLRISWRAAIRILLDTQALLAAYAGVLPKTAEKSIGGPEHQWLISAASLAEIAIKSSSGKLDMEEAEMQRALRDLQVTVLALDASHVSAMFSLPLHHRDPFDRMILATAVVEKLPIVTGDRIFRRYSSVKIIW